MYRLYSFGLVDLSVYYQHFNQVDTVGSGTTPTAYQALPEGGALDLYGSQQKHPSTVERTKSLRLSVSPGNTAIANLESLYFTLLSLRGKRDKLYRRMTGGDIHWQYARLVEVSAERSYETAKYGRIQDISLQFVTQEAFWRGDLLGEWLLDNGEYFDTGLALDSAQNYDLTVSPTVFTITIGTDVGRAPSRAVRMVINAGTVNRSNITIARTNGESITFSGTLLANKDLIIDTGIMQITNDGVDAYSNLVISPTADLASWFSLVTGDNLITITYTGSGSGMKISLFCYEVWY